MSTSKFKPTRATERSPPLEWGGGEDRAVWSMSLETSSPLPNPLRKLPRIQAMNASERDMLAQFQQYRKLHYEAPGRRPSKRSASLGGQVRL